MVEYIVPLDDIFASLADPTRRDILQRLVGKEWSISEIAQHYDLTFAAISKHLKVLEKAKLIIKRKKGKQQLVRLAPETLASAAEYLDWYRQLWEQRLDALDVFLKEGE